MGTELGELAYPWNLTPFQILEAKLIWKLVLKSDRWPLANCPVS